MRVKLIFMFQTVLLPKLITKIRTFKIEKVRENKNINFHIKT